MVVVGIDYSLSNPCVCINYSNTTFEDCDVYFLNKDKKHHGVSLPNIKCDPHIDYLTEQERYDNISTWVMKILESINDIGIFIIIEDYAFSASGRIVNLAENCGLLKHMLYKSGCYRFATISPQVIKKYATGNGAAKKDLMYRSFFNETGVDLVALYSFKKKTKIDSPISDIVDSYYLSKWYWNNLNNATEMGKLNRGTNRKK